MIHAPGILCDLNFALCLTAEALADLIGPIDPRHLRIRKRGKPTLKD